MTKFFRQWKLVIVITAILVGLLASIAISAQVELPKYLATAKYITSTKCKLCHKAQYAAWDKTKHASFKTACPWEADKTKAPAPEDVYRHVTGFNPATNTWAEKGVSCEACHGPGSAHMPAPKDQRKATIIMPDDLATPGQKASVCGRCHGQYTVDGKRYAAKFLPGMDLAKMEGIKFDEVQPGKPMQELNELMTSKHYAKGVVCTTCHVSHDPAATAPHQLKKPVTEQCMSCHKDITMANHAPKAPADATCATCHMPKGAHTFVAPK
ncbi:MAG: cytochrome c3 family protein [Armatimonadota bacterium]